MERETLLHSQLRAQNISGSAVLFITAAGQRGMSQAIKCLVST